MVQNPGNKLAQSILRHAGKVEYFCTAENISPNQAVHELRKLFKRLRSLFRFYVHIPESNAETLREQMKQFGRQLAPLRESFVNARLFEEQMRGENLIPDRKMKTAADAFLLQNRTLVGQNLRESSICKEISHFLTNFDTHLKEAGSQEVSAINIVCELSRSYQKCYGIYHALPAEPSAIELHSLRKKLKRLYFQLDFFRMLLPKFFKAKYEQLNMLNDLLGDDHDFQVLTEALQTGDYGFNAEELQILENQAQHQRELLHAKLFPRLKKFFTDPPGEFDRKLEVFF